MNNLKALFHFTMAGVAVWEYCQSESLFRKQLCGAFGGFHLASAIIDITYPDTDRRCAR
jgi:hypothetical protein